ncbi:MAG: MBL fold metallo-hydrolase [Myxococcales bacterium]
MALEYSVLASGSSGNCTWVRGGGVEVLIDCGLPLRTLTQRLADIGRDVRNVSAVICTHLHGDHIGGIAPLARAHGVTVFGTAPTLAAVRGEPPRELFREIDVLDTVQVGGMTLQAAPTPHDAPSSIAVVAAAEGGRLGVVTDLGHPTELLARRLSGLDALVLEMNHDVEMLETGPYPEHLKRRIRSARGHLSNEQGAELLGRVLHPGLQHLTLAHLSETNNAPRLAQAAAEQVLARGSGAPSLTLAEQRKPTAPAKLGQKRGQLSLFAL